MEGDFLIDQSPQCMNDENFDDIFEFTTLFKRINALLKSHNEEKMPHIVGIFDGFGEGKSSFIECFKKEYSQEYCPIQLDLWKYKSGDIQNDFHRIFYEEKASYYRADRAFQNTLKAARPILKSFRSTAKLPLHLFLLSGAEERALYETYFTLSTSQSAKRKRGEICKGETQAVIIVENLDRLTTKEKVNVLSTLHNYREYFQAHIIVLLDPKSVKDEKEYFEDIINKTFTAFFYLTPKSKSKISKYIDKKFSNVGEHAIGKKIKDLLLSQYPLSLREINHCINNFMFMRKTVPNISDKMERINMFLSVLQVLYPGIYRRVALNPYVLKALLQQSEVFREKDYLSYGLEGKAALKLHKLSHVLGDLDLEDCVEMVSPQNRQLQEKGAESKYLRLELKLDAGLHEKAMKLMLGCEDIDGRIKFFGEALKNRDFFKYLLGRGNFAMLFSELTGLNDYNVSIEDPEKFEVLTKMILSYDMRKYTDPILIDNYLHMISTLTSIIFDSEPLQRLLSERLVENLDLFLAFFIGFYRTRKKFLLGKSSIDSLVVESKYKEGIEKFVFLFILHRIVIMSKIPFSDDIAGELEYEFRKELRTINASQISLLSIEKKSMIEGYFFDIRMAPPTKKFEIAIEIISSELFSSVSIIKKLEILGNIYRELVDADCKDETMQQYISTLLEPLYNILGLALSFREYLRTKEILRLVENCHKEAEERKLVEYFEKKYEEKYGNPVKP